jgi:hypothetical protein
VTTRPTDLATEVAILRLAPPDGCAYCHRTFAQRARWHGRDHLLAESTDRVYLPDMGGSIRVQICTVCDRARACAVLGSLAATQDHCLRWLLLEGSLTEEQVATIRADRETRSLLVSSAELTELREAEIAYGPPKPMRRLEDVEADARNAERDLERFLRLQQQDEEDGDTPRRTRAPRCRFCQEPGHDARNCPKRGDAFSAQELPRAVRNPQT